MSTPQQREVFTRCMRLSKELEESEQVEDALAVATALQVYLDIFPICPDGSDRKMAMNRLSLLSSKVQEKRTRL